MSFDSLDSLLPEAYDQADTVRRAVDDWWRAKQAGETEPGRIYGRRVVTAAWELYETIERMRDEDLSRREAINRLLRAFRDTLGVSRDDLWFAARACSHRADAMLGGKTARYFGGPPVSSSTNSVQRSEASSGATPRSGRNDVGEWVWVQDVTITIVGQNPDRRVVLAADIVREAASLLVDELSHLLSSDAG